MVRKNGRKGKRKTRKGGSIRGSEKGSIGYRIVSKESRRVSKESRRVSKKNRGVSQKSSLSVIKESSRSPIIISPKSSQTSLKAIIMIKAYNLIFNH
jgi:hypothetical protein